MHYQQQQQQQQQQVNNSHLLCYSPRSVMMLSNLSQQSPTNKKRPLRRVHWGEDSTFEYKENNKSHFASSFSGSATYQKWYGADDVQSFRDERKTAIKLSREYGAKEIELSGLATCRGIEHLDSKKSFDERHQRTQLAVQVVLDASIQYRRLTRERRDKVIAIQYASVCLHSKKLAHDRARVYWEETKKTLESDDHGSGVPPPPPRSSSSSSSSKNRKSIRGSPWLGSPSKRRGIRALLKALPAI